MKKILSLSLLSLIFALSTEGKGGDSIRSQAPMTALILDARDGNESPLTHAYFDEGVDYFLDFETPNHPITRDLYYLREAGRLVEGGDYTSAEQRLQTIGRFQKEKMYLEGAILAAEGKYEQGLDYFRRLIDERSSLSRHLSSLSFLGAARIFHEIGDYKQAIYHYTQVRPLESEFVEAVYEKGWSYYQDGDMNGALGMTLSFLSPYFESAFYPDALLLRAAAFYQLCYYERANLALEKLKTDYHPIRAQIAAYLQREPQTYIFEDRFLKAMNPKLVGYMVGDNKFRASLRAYLALKDESQKIRGEDLSINKQALAFVKAKLAQETTRVLQRADKVLQNILAQADMIQIDILQSSANKLLGEEPEHKLPIKTIGLADMDFDPIIQFWPFKGEFWLDELGSYYYGLKSTCS